MTCGERRPQCAWQVHECHDEVVAPMRWQPLLQHEAMCPMCASPIVPETGCFYRCQWRYEGVKLDSGLHSSRVPDAAFSYHEFRRDVGDLVLWQHLLVVAQPLANADCAVCGEPLSVPRHRLVVPPCDHAVLGHGVWSPPPVPRAGQQSTHRIHGLSDKTISRVFVLAMGAFNINLLFARLALLGGLCAWCRRNVG
ncbi:Aste57867_15311 [Aphanomyces stellatus]|uniref:Aste57867_15311 protein n=1 Tax=Aphanomyces stellatus TaxID=120398 RepID=A0A485L346_9STRA|nr:hypothetical protein As57867_015255 [Aphanomyces stellatus]VFT92120.1 Aste57867_15311 [Aphanomyces stellatus]